jgi:Gram-negative bacterial TonB protein C-terminal
MCFLALFVLSAQESTSSLPAVTKFECPQYPEKARSAHISGTVKMTVTTDGHAVTDVKIISGPQILAQPAEANVRTWKFADHTPTTFPVVYVYASEGYFKKDPITKCAAKMNLPSEVIVSIEIPVRTLY